MTADEIKIAIGNLYREVSLEEMSSSQRAQLSILERLMDIILESGEEDVIITWSKNVGK